MRKEMKRIVKIKNNVKRYNLNSVSSNNNSFTNTSRSSNKFNNRTKWNNNKSTNSSSNKRKCKCIWAITIKSSRLPNGKYNK